MHSGKGSLQHGRRRSAFSGARSLVLVATVLGGLGCSGSGPASESIGGPATDGGVTASDPALSAGASVVRTLSAIPALSEHLGQNRKLERVGDGYRLVHPSVGEHVGGWSSAGVTIEATLPAKARAP